MQKQKKQKIRYACTYQCIPPLPLWAQVGLMVGKLALVKYPTIDSRLLGILCSTDKTSDKMLHCA